LVADRLDEETLFQIAWNNRGTCVPSGESGIAGVEDEATLDFIGRVTVALVAVVAKDGLDLLLKILRVHRRSGNERGERGK